MAVTIADLESFILTSRNRSLGTVHRPALSTAMRVALGEVDDLTRAANPARTYGAFRKYFGRWLKQP
jgi:hypothetical protein